MKLNRNLIALLAIAVIILSGCTAVVAAENAPVTMSDAYAKAMTESVSVEAIEFEISEDMNKFIFDQDIVFDDGLPAHGSSFITEGYIYEAGTLNGSNGMNADGSPEFPDKVIGKWICNGKMYGDAAHATGGAWVVSTQLLMFDEAHGGGTIVTEGMELADIGVFADRVVTGGSGRFLGKTIAAEQALQGLNATEGVVLSYRLDVHQ